MSCSLTNDQQRLLEQMKTVVLEKEKVKQDLEHSNRARDSYWKDFNKSQAEMNVLQKSMVIQHRSSWVI